MNKLKKIHLQDRMLRCPVSFGVTFTMTAILLWTNIDEVGLTEGVYRYSRHSNTHRIVNKESGPCIYLTETS